MGITTDIWVVDRAGKSLCRRRYVGLHAEMRAYELGRALFAPVDLAVGGPVISVELCGFWLYDEVARLFVVVGYAGTCPADMRMIELFMEGRRTQYGTARWDVTQLPTLGWLGHPHVVIVMRRPTATLEAMQQVVRQGDARMMIERRIASYDTKQCLIL